MTSSSASDPQHRQSLYIGMTCSLFILGVLVYWLLLSPRTSRTDPRASRIPPRSFHPVPRAPRLYEPTDFFRAPASLLSSARPLRYVVAISIDGLRSDVITQLGAETLPTFYRLMKEGSYTLNARTDADYTYTIPNHTCMLTGRGVRGSKGHGISWNRMPRRSIHAKKGSYVASVFDTLHDHGRTTALFASKRKFVLYSLSYNALRGAKDLVAPDHGRNKIDVVGITRRDHQTMPLVLHHLRKNPTHFTFLHLRGPDSAGHRHRWMSRPYRNAVQQQDRYLGQILAAVEQSPKLKKRTTLLVTSDHGGHKHTHLKAERKVNYTIPFFAWGAGVKAGSDLYKLNAPRYRDPGAKQVPHNTTPQPIRNCNIANVSTRLLGLPPVTGSTVGTHSPLRLH
ncbi:MAG: hypothetical protein EP343_24800 [Deltaproteobacteria bacterium]|nr:MAG: hypothetical protein EP343_24800 [Deltaproteobacteria bacterium]